MKATPPKFVIPVILLSLLMAVVPFQKVQADAGPHPSMRFVFISQIDPKPAIVSGRLLNCQDEGCIQSEPLREIGPQRFECQSYSCYSTAYSSSPYYRLEIEFSDGVTRQSNIFTKRAFAAHYQVTILAQSLQVEEKPLGPNIPLFKAGAPTLWNLVATVAFPFLEIILIIIVLALANRTGRVGAETASYYGWMEAGWLLAIPAILVGMQWTQGLITTLVVELLLGTVYVLWKKRSASIILTMILLLNLVTQPVLWITLSGFSGLSPIFLIFFAEGVVWLVEAGGLYLSQRNTIRFQEALWVSLTLNVASFVVGIFLPI
jgi:hypothetical protein